MDTSDFPSGSAESQREQSSATPQENANPPAPAHAETEGTQQPGSRPAPQPGTQQPPRRKFFRRNAGGQQQQQRNGQNGFQRRPPNNKNGNQRGAAFSGPMDHSYRQQNGNEQVNQQQYNKGGRKPKRFGGRGGGRFRPGFSNRPRNNAPAQNFVPQHNQAVLEPLPHREDAVTRIFAFVEDLFFLTKITDTARKLNVGIEFVKTLEELMEKSAAAGAEPPALVIFDLNNANAKPLTLIPKIKAKFKKATSILGFVSHVQGDLKLKAQEAGCDSVMPRSAFSQNLPQLLRRHGSPEDLDQQE